MASERPTNVAIPTNTKNRQRQLHRTAAKDLRHVFLLADLRSTNVIAKKAPKLRVTPAVAHS